MVPGVAKYSTFLYLERWITQQVLATARDYVDVKVSGWQEVHITTKDDWKSITVEFGEQSVMISFATRKLPLSARVLDSGLYYESVHSISRYDSSRA